MSQEQSLESVAEGVPRSRWITLPGKFTPAPLTPAEQKKFDELREFERRSWDPQSYKNIRYD